MVMIGRPDRLLQPAPGRSDWSPAIGDLVCGLAAPYRTRGSPMAPSLTPNPAEEAARLLSAGHVDAARQRCRAILEKDRRNVRANWILAYAAHLAGDLTEAATHAQRCITLRPAEARHHALLGEIRTTQGKYRQAIDCYRKALRADGRFMPALAGKAEVQRRRNDLEAARATLEATVEAGREDAAVATVWTRICAQANRPEDGIPVAERHLGDGVSHEIGRGLHFALAKAHEAAGRFDDAAAAYGSANALSRRDYDHAADVRRTDQLIELFTAERIAALPRPAEPSELPVFIVGMLRSGSTLIEQIIDAHPRAAGIGESTALQRIAGELNAESVAAGHVAGWPDCVRFLEPSDVETRAAEYLGLVRAEAGSGTVDRIADKQLGNALLLGLIACLFPAGRVIHARRRPLDTCLSCWTEKMPPGTNAFTSDLRSMGLAYREHHRLMDHWAEVLPAVGLAWHAVDYEALVGDQEAESRRLIEFCGLPWDDRCLRFHESGRIVLTLSSAQVARPIYGSSVGRADRFGAALDPLREALGDLA